MSADMIMDWAMETGIAVTILIAFIMLIRKPVAKHIGAGAAYALWVLPVIRIFTPVITLPALSSSAAPSPPMMTGYFYVSGDPVPIAGDPINWAPLIIGTWIGGAILYLLWQLMRQHGLRAEIRRQSTTANLATQSSARRIAARLELKKVPMILISSSKIGPLVTGLLKPVIVLPTDFETAYNRKQQEFALAHELSHVKRSDLWVAAGALFFRALNWPNPLAHMAAPAFRADQEAACDASVLARLGNNPITRSGYAETLIHAAKMAGQPARPMPLGLTIFNPLKERIMILKETPQKRTGLRMVLGGVAIGALLATAPYTIAQQSPETPETPDTEITAKSVEKQVMKWVTKDDNGNETKRHVEIVTENGETRAYEIDDYGNKTEVEPGSIEMPTGHAGHAGARKMRIVTMDNRGDLDMEALAGSGDGNMKVIVKRIGDGDVSEMDIDIEDLVGEGMEGQNVFVFESEEDIQINSDGEKQVIVKKTHGPGHGFAFANGGGAGELDPEMWVKIASEMMGNVDTDGLDRQARKKVEAAIEALADAQEELAEE
ncbi:MAG: hypothetical protein HKN36_08950 [Hellea sp.]|nr:hypothetical protein [Hellea sp.]